MVFDTLVPLSMESPIIIIAMVVSSIGAFVVGKSSGGGTFNPVEIPKSSKASGVFFTITVLSTVEFSSGLC